jgi:glucose/mannose-6-phosphate isomerase
MQLDNLKKMNSLDKGRVADSIDALGAQIEQVISDGAKIKIPESYKKVNKVVVSGMGGSNLGPRIIKSALADRIKVPFIIEPGYEVPKYVDSKTLFILSSYSGTTEETLSVISEVQKRKAKLAAITADNGNKNPLAELIRNGLAAGYAFEPANNPSGQPRLGGGYSIMGILTILKNSGLLEVQKEEIVNAIKLLKIQGEKLNPSIKINGNPAKKLAIVFDKKAPVFISGDSLEGNLHAIRNQVNECGKNFSAYLSIPELNHYAMEGLEYPKAKKDFLHFIFFDSKLFHPRVQLRLKLTKKIVEKNTVKYSDHLLAGKTRLEQAFELLQLGAWISYYSGMLNDVDPVKIEWVDWFKAELGKVK